MQGYVLCHQGTSPSLTLPAHSRTCTHPHASNPKEPTEGAEHLTGTHLTPPVLRNKCQSPPPASPSWWQFIPHQSTQLCDSGHLCHSQHHLLSLLAPKTPFLFFSQVSLHLLLHERGHLHPLHGPTWSTALLSPQEPLSHAVNNPAAHL